MESVQATLTVLGCKANQGEQATLAHGCQWQELGLQPEQEPDQELDLGAEWAGRGRLASRAGRAAPELELELWWWQEQGQGLRFEAGLGMKWVQGQW